MEGFLEYGLTCRGLNDIGNGDPNDCYLLCLTPQKGGAFGDR